LLHYVLLERVPFWDDAALTSANNRSGTYIEECVRRGFIASESDLQLHLSKYAKRHLYSVQQCQELITKIQHDTEFLQMSVICVVP